MIRIWIIVSMVGTMGAGPVETRGYTEVPEFSFGALRCDDVKNNAMYGDADFCDEDQRLGDEQAGVEEVDEGLTIIQQAAIRAFKGFKCTKRVSVITTLCGMFSHVKLQSPMDILKPQRVTVTECKYMRDAQSYKTEDQRELPISPGSTITYKYVAAGSITLSEHDVACTGGVIQAQGEKHDSMLRLVTVDVTLSELEILEDDEDEGRLTANGEKLSRVCAVRSEGCVFERGTVVFSKENRDKCHYHPVRTSQFRHVVRRGQAMVKDIKHKILLEWRNRTVIEDGCPFGKELIRTNFDRLFILPGGVWKDPSVMKPIWMDTELEARVTDFFLLEQIWELEQRVEKRRQLGVCHDTRDGLTSGGLTLHGNHVLKKRGEVVVEFPCTPVTVKTRLGFKDTEDCLDHLTVFTDAGEKKYLAPTTRLLVDRDAVNRINCSAHYPLIFRDDAGLLITANPEVQRVSGTLNRFHVEGSDSEDHRELFSMNSLLYTSDEIKQYETMLQGHAGEKSITQRFTSYLCEKTGACYPSVKGGELSWQSLLDPIGAANQWIARITNQVSWWGGLLSAFWLVWIGIQVGWELTARIRKSRSQYEIAGVKTFTRRRTTAEGRIEVRAEAEVEQQGLRAPSPVEDDPVLDRIRAALDRAGL